MHSCECLPKPGREGQGDRAMAEREMNSKAETRTPPTRSTSTVRAAATPSDRVASDTCPPPGPSARMTRRELLRGLGASAIVALAGCLPIGLEDVPVPSQPPTAAPDATAAALAEVTQPDCEITPRQTEGPFYFDVVSMAATRWATGAE